MSSSCEKPSDLNVDEVFQVILRSSRDLVRTQELVLYFHKIWKEINLDETLLEGRECDVETMQLVMNLVRKACEVNVENHSSIVLTFFEFVLQRIVLLDELTELDRVEIVLKKLLEHMTLLLFRGYGKDFNWLAEVEESFLRISLFLFVKVLKVPRNRSKTLEHFAPEIFYVCLFLCHCKSPEDVSWIEEQVFSREFIDTSDSGPDVLDKKNSSYWTCIRYIQLLGVHKRVENIHSLVGQLWPALQPIFVKALKYEDNQRKDNVSSEQPSFISYLIKYCLSLMGSEELESYLSSILALLVPLSQDFDRQRRVQTLHCFKLLLYRCSSFAIEQHKSSFYVILRVLCRFREPDLIDALLTCIIYFIQQIQTQRSNCFSESCTSDFFQLVDAVIDIVSYCTLGSSSFAINMNELRHIVSIHLASFLQTIDKSIYPRLQRILPCICELLERTCSSNKSIETSCFQNTAEALKLLLFISQPFIPFYLQTLLGSIVTCVVHAKVFLDTHNCEIVCSKCIDLLDLVRVNSEPGIFWNCLNESEEVGKESPGLDGVTEWIVRYRKHVVDRQYMNSNSLEKQFLDTFDDLFENSSNPFKRFLDISTL